MLLCKYLLPMRLSTNFNNINKKIKLDHNKVIYENKDHEKKFIDKINIKQIKFKTKSLNILLPKSI